MNVIANLQPIRGNEVTLLPLLVIIKVVHHAVSDFSLRVVWSIFIDLVIE